ncbi:MAG: SDR family NAD(P)-dependent oxidoreductase [Bacteroidales bacterium]
MITYITGATSGIGKACAEIFAKNGSDLVITGRRKERLDELKKDLENRYGIHVTVSCYDIRDRGSVETAWEELPDKWKEIDILVNNAGLAAGLEPIHEGNPDNWERMIDTNLKGLLYISRLVTARMTEQKSGHVINIGSIAGKEAYAGGNVYCATKHAVEGLTKAMRIDLLPFGIKVSQIAPGAVETEFSLVRFNGDRERAANVYNGYEPLGPEDVAEAVWFVASRPKHVNINDLLIMPAAQANATTFNRRG